LDSPVIFLLSPGAKIRPQKKKKKKNIDYVLMINELHKTHTCHSWEGDEIYKGSIKIIY
jgi:hypothetical protein